MIQARFELDEHTIKVLDTFKARHGLRNRNEALNRFVLDYGEDYADFPIGPKTLRRIDRIIEEHKKNYPDRRMTLEELDELLGMPDV